MDWETNYYSCSCCLLFYLTFGVQNSESAKFQRRERGYTSKPERSSVAAWSKYMWKGSLKKAAGRKREGTQAKPGGVS